MPRVAAHVRTRQQGAPNPMTAAEALRFMAVQVERIGTKSLAARAWGVSPKYLSLVLHEKREIGPKLAKALGLTPQRFLIYRYQQEAQPHA